MRCKRYRRHVLNILIFQYPNICLTHLSLQKLSCYYFICKKRKFAFYTHKSCMDFIQDQNVLLCNRNNF